MLQFYLTATLLSATYSALGQPPGSDTGNESIARPFIESATYIDQLVNNNVGPSVKKRDALNDVEKDKKAKVSPPEKTAAKNPVPVAMLPLVDGAKSPQEAISIYVKAAIAGDAEAALLMLDPAVRDYYQIEIVSEELVIQSRLIQEAAFGNVKPLGGVATLFARRSLLRPKKIRILETRKINDEKIAFTVLVTEKSYHSEGDQTVIRELLCLQCNQRWHLFLNLGVMTQLLREFGSKEGLTEVLRSSKQPLRENADYQVRYKVPLETIHQHIANLSRSPEIAELLKTAQAGHRHYKSVVNRFMRGDITSRDQFRTSLEPAYSIVDKVMTERMDLTLAVIDQLQSLRTKSE